MAHAALVATAARVPGLGIWAGFVDGEFIGRWTLEPPHHPDQGPVDRREPARHFPVGQLTRNGTTRQVRVSLCWSTAEN